MSSRGAWGKECQSALGGVKGKGCQSGLGGERRSVSFGGCSLYTTLTSKVCTAQKTTYWLAQLRLFARRLAEKFSTLDITLFSRHRGENGSPAYATMALATALAANTR